MLLGRPLAAAASSHGPGLIEAVRDLEGAGLDARFLEHVSSALGPGDTGILAELVEDAPPPSALCLLATETQVLRQQLGSTPQETRLIDQLGFFAQDLAAQCGATRGSEAAGRLRDSGPGTEGRGRRCVRG